jgi:hypothetical protein
MNRFGHVDDARSHGVNEALQWLRGHLGRCRCGRHPSQRPTDFTLAVC